MTDQEAIKTAKDYHSSKKGWCGPIIKIPPRGCVDEITTVNLRDWDRPIVMREPSSNYGPGQYRTAP